MTEFRDCRGAKSKELECESCRVEGFKDFGGFRKGQG